MTGLNRFQRWLSSRQVAFPTKCDLTAHASIYDPACTVVFPITGDEIPFESNVQILLGALNLMNRCESGFFSGTDLIHVSAVCQAGLLNRKHQAITVVITVCIFIPAHDDLAIKMHNLRNFLTNIPRQGCHLVPDF